MHIAATNCIVLETDHGLKSNKVCYDVLIVCTSFSQSNCDSLSLLNFLSLAILIAEIWKH